MKHNEFIKEKRQIRVFISSSFEDMDKERNYLRETVFPLIQEKAYKRAVAVTALDLRWGIPNGTDLGETIEICMNEIDNSFPFFIGIVGGHYGTQPDKSAVYDSNRILKEQYSVLCEYFEKKMSITEMEMRYGVLDCNEQEKKQINALFLTRKSDLKAISNDSRLNALNDAIHFCGEQFEEEKIAKDEKNHIWTSDYSSVEEFGKIVQIVFEDILDRLFPEDKDIDDFQKQYYMQKAVLSDLSRFYVPNDEIIRNINNFIDDPLKQKLLIVGDSGCGKSSLLAYWISNYALKYSEKGYDLIYHFVGSGESEKDSKKIEQRLLHELIMRFNIVVPENDEGKDSLYKFFNKEQLREQRRFIIIVDAVNQLETGIDLNWLRLGALPRDVKFIISTLKGDETEKTILKTVPDQTITVRGLLDASDRRKAIDFYVKDYHRKELGDENIRKIVNWSLSQNPLALKSLLNELIVAGKYDKMDSLVENYITCTSIESLFNRILIRISNNPRYSWVKDALGAIALSRYGLSEDELLKIIPVHILYWSSFYCSFKRHFFVRNGLITFSHQYLRNAVERFCFANNERRKRIHSLLISLFKDGTSSRDYEELMHHYYALEDYKSVYKIASDPETFHILWKSDSQSLISYWNILLSKGFSPENLIPIDQQFENDGVYSDYCGELQWLFSTLHLYNLSLKLFQVLQQHIDNGAGTFGLEHTRRYRLLAESYSENGEMEKAIELYKQSFHEMVSNTRDGIRFKIGFNEDSPSFLPENANTYISISECYRLLGRYSNCEKFLKYAERSLVFEDKYEGYSQDPLVAFYMEKYKLYSDLGDSKNAMTSLEKCSGKASGYNNWALIYYEYGDYPQAISLWHRYLNIIKGDSDTTTGFEASMVYREIAKNLNALGKNVFAKRFLDASLECLQDRDNSDYHKAKTYTILAYTYYTEKEYGLSLKYYKDASAIFESCKVWSEWIDACQNAAILYSWTNETKEGLALLQKILLIAEQEQCVTDYKKGQLLWTMSSLEFAMHSYTKSFEHSRLAFSLLLNKLGAQDEQTSKIIQRLDTCILKETSLMSLLPKQSCSSSLSKWERYGLLVNERELSPTIKAYLCCNKIFSSPDIWQIIHSLRYCLEDKNAFQALAANNLESFFDNILSYVDRDFDTAFLLRVYMMIILSPNGAKESHISSLSKISDKGNWESFVQKYGSLLNIYKGKVFLVNATLKSVIISHYFKYNGKDCNVLNDFADEMSHACHVNYFSHIVDWAYYRQLSHDADTLKEYVNQTNTLKPHNISLDLTSKALIIVSKYCSRQDNIVMTLLCQYFNILLYIKSIEDETIQEVARNLQQCTNFESISDVTRGYVCLVAGIREYKEKGYVTAISLLHKYYKFAYSNDTFDNKIKWYRMVKDCLNHIESYNIENIVPPRFLQEWTWESNKYKHIDNSILYYFQIERVIEDKDNNRIIIELNENPKQIFTYSTTHRFRFVRYGTETRIALYGKIRVIICCRRGIWYDFDDNSEVMNLYRIKYPDGIKLMDFKTFVSAVLKRNISSITDSGVK